MINKQYYKTLYAITNKYTLESTRYNSHYMIYRNKKNAEKALERLKREYSRYNTPIFNSYLESLKIVEYRLVEDNTDET